MIALNYIENGIAKSVNVNENDRSYRYRGLMQRPKLMLQFSLPEYIDFGKNAYISYDGNIFYSPERPDLKKNGERNIEYTFNMVTYENHLSQYKMRNSVDGRLKYSMCSTPSEFIAEIVANLNARDGAGVWSVGDCIDMAPKTIEFNHCYIDAALSQVADEFETEWEIVNHAIHLHTVKYNENAPLPLSYGKGNGFEPGVGRATPTGEQPIKRLYVQGGNRNIDRSTYGYPDLMLPFGQSIQFDGEYFGNEAGFNPSKARTYQSDANGYYIERIDGSPESSKEDSIDCSDRYPSRVGTVSSVVVVDAGRNFYDFIDASIPNDINYGDNNVSNPPSCLIEGETLTVIFQTGMLAGKEFDVKHHYADKRFEIVPFEYDGITMPNATWSPAVGDTYIIFGCMLPQSYICDNNAKEGASWDMFRMAVRYLYANEDQKFTFSGKLQAKWSRANWATISPKLVVGGYIHFSDTQFAPDGTDIRIIGIKDYLTDPYALTIDISNGIVGQSVTTTLVQVGCQEVTIGEAHTNSINFTKRRFRDTIDTMLMLQESLLEFSEGINPITVHAMQLLIGDEGLQFVFTDWNEVEWPAESVIIMNNSTKRLNVVNPSTANPQSELVLKHTSIMHAIHSTIPPTYSKWIMTPFTSQVLSNQNQGYYLYAKCSSAEGVNMGEFVLSATAIGMESMTGYYHFLVGILGKEYDGERSFVPLYGFTEILPGRITTDKIVSSDGQSYFDLTGGGYVCAKKAKIWGTYRSPFHLANSNEDPFDEYDNIKIVTGAINLPWNNEQSGRKVTIAGEGYLNTPPYGMHYYIHGLEVDGLVSFEQEIVQLVGIGTEGQFYGWQVNWIDGFQNDRTRAAFGSFMNVLMVGRIYYNNISESYRMDYDDRANGGAANLESASDRTYVVSVPSHWFNFRDQVDVDNELIVIATSKVSGVSVSNPSNSLGVEDRLVYITFRTATVNETVVKDEFNFFIFNKMNWH